jgi:hypothetical protein
MVTAVPSSGSTPTSSANGIVVAINNFAELLLFELICRRL